MGGIGALRAGGDGDDGDGVDAIGSVGVNSVAVQGRILLWAKAVSATLCLTGLEQKMATDMLT